ncbi:MAG: DNA polymerase/3'-5' exonuclease PolX [Pirellulales bacterium]
MTNSQIADVFERLADLLEISGANPFRVRAYRNAARTLSGYPESLADRLADDGRLPEIPGIGDDLSDKIRQLAAGERLALLDELEAKIPAGVLTLLKVPGLGPKKAAALHRELGIETLDQLREACEAGRVKGLKGFGAKTEQLILQGIGLAATASLRMLWADADAIARQLKTHMLRAPGVEQLELAGSYRRGKETIGDLDMLVVSTEVDPIMDHFGAFAESAQVIARGETKMSIRTHGGLQIDLRVVPARSFGAALQYFTGSKEHNVILRGRAKQRGLKINEYGVFRVAEGASDDAKGPQAGEYVAGETEPAVYAALDLPWIAPELREGRQEYDWADARALPQLIELPDIVGDLHMHTTATDGAASLEEMVQAAQLRGLQYIAITDHSQRVSMARGLDADRLLAQWREIDRLNERLEGRFLVLKGIECDILERGGMDLPDDVLAQADWVLASVHYGQKQSRAQITDRILGAIANPYVSAVAHPTGRLLNQRAAYEVDMETVMQAAVEHRKLLELNAHPVRLDLHDLHCAQAKSLGIPIVINTDAHAVEGLDMMRYGVLQARRGGLTAADVANTRSWPELKKLIGPLIPDPSLRRKAGGEKGA